MGSRWRGPLGMREGSWRQVTDSTMSGTTSKARVINPHLDGSSPATPAKKTRTCIRLADASFRATDRRQRNDDVKR
jgi:hypothetical protein